MVREIQRLQRAGAAGIAQPGRNVVIPEAPEQEGDSELYDSNSPLARELQLHPWPIGYKPRISAFDGKANPRKFIASYETALSLAGEDAQIMVKSLIMAVEDIAHDWYISLKPLSINSWQQLKAELLATFQGYQPGAKTMRDLLNCIQRNDESLSEYLG